MNSRFQAMEEQTKEEPNGAAVCLDLRMKGDPASPRKTAIRVATLTTLNSKWHNSLSNLAISIGRKLFPASVISEKLIGDTSGVYSSQFSESFQFSREVFEFQSLLAEITVF